MILYFGAIWVTALLTEGDGDPAELALAFAHSMVPIAFASVQASSIVVGHVGAVVVAHDSALTRFPPRQAAQRPAPLLAVMVGSAPRQPRPGRDAGGGRRAGIRRTLSQRVSQ